MGDNVPRRTSNRFFFHSPLVLVPILGLLYSAVFLAYHVVQSSASSGTVGFFTVLLLSFSVVYVLAVVGIWKRPRVGYVVAAIVSGLSLILLGALENVSSTLATPVDTQNFIFAATVFPALFTSTLYSVLGFRDLRLRVQFPISSPTVRGHGVWSVLIVGFILGSLLIGLMAGATQSRLLSSLSKPADITIVEGAGLPKNPNSFSPSEFAAHVGQTITWVNLDSTFHTVTSISNAFDSGRMDVGSRFQLTFAKAGDYDYYCIYHSWMNGEITVT